MNSVAASLIAIVAIFVAVACGGSDSKGSAVGATCGQSGAADQCVSGAICGKPSDGTTVLQCLVVCKEQTDCAANQDCNGVEGSVQKGCRPKSGTDAGVDSGKK